MRALVTGATGFVGGHVARAALRHGYTTRMLVRSGSTPAMFAGLPVEVAHGDLRDRSALAHALDGCDVLFHVAAAYTFWSPDPQPIYESNVTGTENVLAAARAAGVRKVVYTSTESTIGVPEGGLGTEELDVDPATLAGAYKRTKYLAEQVARRMGREGLPIVIVNPTTPVGPGDARPTPTGQFIVDFLNGRMPAYVNTGLNLIDVEDVAEGHVLALEKGRAGERYILGNRNLSFHDILVMLGQIAGRPVPRVRLPLWFALGAAYANEAAAMVTGRPPRIPVAAVRTAHSIRHFDCSKAIRELGLPQTPIEQALRKAVAWFRQHGYVP